MTNLDYPLLASYFTDRRESPVQVGSLRIPKPPENDDEPDEFFFVYLWTKIILTATSVKGYYTDFINLPEFNENTELRLELFKFMCDTFFEIVQMIPRWQVESIKDFVSNMSETEQAYFYLLHGDKL